MSATVINAKLQNSILSYFKTNKVQANLYLINGIKLLGTVLDFDDTCVLVEGKDRSPQLIYKHAISTVGPASALKYSEIIGNQETQNDSEQN